ncbi:pilin N-terminal domain-containing protein [Lacticaseibacillus yichunensis]|uniref:Pilin N-terminal domain-containing protein n=1 Tax=Lacticaseibacillus yichunensis TaxID=2486015 RepID=A0ABW4CPF3_9LACO|nr:pilin N-terminal domain-containing protein [Lacticaseibacillus yichunensis]
MKNSLVKKALIVIGAALLALPLAANGLNATTVKADGETQKVTLTKYVSASNQPTGNPVPVDTLPATADKANNARVDGAEYSVYDVTAQYWSKIKDGTLTAADANQADDNGHTTVFDLTDAKPDLSDTTQNGQVTFDLPKSSNGQPAVYLFRETKTPAGYKTSFDFVLSLPVKAPASDGVAYVYPKEQVDKTYKLKFTKVDETNTKTVLAGAKFYIKQGDLYAAIKGSENAALTELPAGASDVSWGTRDQATTFVSNDKGEFGFEANPEATVDGVLTGLDPDKSYTIEEVAAPNGYNKDAAIDGKAAADASVKPGDNATTVTDTPEGILPHTGGAGIVAFVVLGVALIALGGVAYNKRRAA